MLLNEVRTQYRIAEAETKVIMDQEDNIKEPAAAPTFKCMAAA